MVAAGTFAGVASKLILTLAIAQLEIRPIGPSSINSQGIWVGEGVRGPEVRVYAASGWGGNGRGYEWKYAAGTWESEEIYSGVGVAYSPMVAIAGEGGEKRLYVGSYSNKRLFEVSAEPGGWSTLSVPGSQIDNVVCVRAAAGRNDGVQRIYISHAGTSAEAGLYEFSWSDASASWERLKVHGRNVGEFAVADGRGDGVLRIYAGAREGGDGGLVEFTWDGSQYAGNVLRFDGILGGRIQTTYVGDGRGDGKNRVYVNEWGGPLHELSYEGGAWAPLKVAGAATRFYLASGRLRADNKPRIYAVVKKSGVFEHTWDGAGFEATVDAVTSATGKAVVADGRGDNKNRLYAGKGDGSLFPGAIAEVSDPDPPEAVTGGARFLRGDSNADGEIDISDGVFVLIYLFLGGGSSPPCSRSADPDSTGTIEISDAIYILNFLFLDGPPPKAPFPECGSDPGGGELTCEAYPPCH
jgi:hypothetical protein